MPAYPGFVGPSARVRSVNVNAERTVNWYPEQSVGTAKTETWLVPTPGLEPFAVLSEGPVRALFAQNGRVFAVGGIGFYEVFQDGRAQWYGAVGSDGRPATISSNGSNGNQLFITSTGAGYIFNLATNAMTPLTGASAPPSPVAMGCFSDGYFLSLKEGGAQFNISDLYDGTSWDAADVFLVSTVADHLVAMIESHRDLWLFGSQTTSIWANTGDADNPYQPIAGVKVDQGCAAQSSVVRLDNTVFWLGQSEAGDRMVFRAQGYTPQRVSDHAVEFALRQASRVDDAIAYAYQDEGHTFYVLYVPGLAHVPEFATTWVYDVATSAWHERALWDQEAMRWQPHLGRCHAFGFGRHLVGDRLSPAIYDMRHGAADDVQVIVGGV